MPLPKPALDNRTFDQLVAEVRAQLPRLAPHWTDHNASDPGITLIELCSWLAEQNIYRFDRPSDEALRAFAGLAGAQSRPPGIAQTVVAIANASANGVALPERIQLATASAAAFETTEPLFASPAALVSVVAHGRDPPHDATNDNARSLGYPAFGERPRRGHALYLGFDRALDAAGATLCLHVWTETWAADDATQAALITEFDAMVQRTRDDCSCAAWKAAAASHDWRRHYAVTTTWEYYAGHETWRPLAGVVDETRALSLSGFIRFAAPSGHEPDAPGGTYRIRCRILGGRFECPPRLQHIAFNAVRAEHALSRKERALKDPARGHAHAVFSLGEAPVVAGETNVRLRDGAGRIETDWQEVFDWDRSGPHALHYLVTPERGEFQSGDGLRAEVLPAGRTLLVTYRVGGGDAGNLSAGSLASVALNLDNLTLQPALGGLPTGLVVVQPFAALGGTPRESLRARQARAFALAHEVDKAVTIEDFESLAESAPALPIARVHAVAALHPDLPCYAAPGVVTLIVVPRCRLPAPLPSRALLGCVDPLPRPAPTRHVRSTDDGAALPAHCRVCDAARRVRRRRRRRRASRAKRCGARRFLRSDHRRPRPRRLARRPHRLPQRGAGFARRSQGVQRVTGFRTEGFA